jgi:anti-sigma regulatory factor (Ser/Thr protein kinase)
VVAEALTNIAKRAGTQQATVTARVDNGALRVEVCDRSSQPKPSGAWIPWVQTLQ